MTEIELKDPMELIHIKDAEIVQLRATLTGVTQWLEENQPDVFRRGIWDAIAVAQTLSTSVLS